MGSASSMRMVLGLGVLTDITQRLNLQVIPHCVQFLARVSIAQLCTARYRCKKSVFPAVCLSVRLSFAALVCR